MISKGFYEQLEVIANERHLELEDVKKAVGVALVKACQLEGCKGEITIEFNDEQKKIRMYNNFHVVDEIDPEGPDGQILLEEAKEMRARVKVGSEIKTEISFSTIGRKGGKLVTNVDVFDVFNNIEPGKKSIAFRDLMPS